MTIREFSEQTAHVIDAKLHDERGDWSTGNVRCEYRDTLREWLFDRIPREDGQYCWEVRINGLRGYLFACYSDDDGIEAIEFRHRNKRWHSASQQGWAPDSR